MKIDELLKGISCSCGKHHSCEIENVYIENNAVKRLKMLCQDYNNILVVADQNTYYAAGDKVLNYISNKNVKNVIFSGKTLLIPNENAVNAINSSLDNTELIIGIGSGVIQDLCKYVSFNNKIPYFIVATAPSMDGYASTGAAMIMNGMKVTYPAGLPQVILADTDVLKNAPLKMIKAGYGDIVGKYSALNDWMLSREVNGEYFCQYIYDLTLEMVEKTLSLSDGLLRRDEKSVAVLMEALVTVGIAMSFAGSSRPASGSEHHLSHFFEITGILNCDDYLPHGIDVAYSTVIIAKLHEILLSTDLPKKQYIMNKDEYTNNINRVYKSIAQGCIELQDKVGNYNKERLNIYKQKDTVIRKILAEMPTSNQIVKMLQAVELDINEFYKFYGKEKIKEAVYFAKDLKDRYTILWMYYDFFGNK